MSRRDDLHRLIDNHKRRLQKLQEQQARFGKLHTPAHILIEIEDTATEIKRLQAELGALPEMLLSALTSIPRTRASA